MKDGKPNQYPGFFQKMEPACNSAFQTLSHQWVLFFARNLDATAIDKLRRIVGSFPRKYINPRTPYPDVDDPSGRFEKGDYLLEVEYYGNRGDFVDYEHLKNKVQEAGFIVSDEPRPSARPEGRGSQMIVYVSPPTADQLVIPTAESPQANLPPFEVAHGDVSPSKSTRQSTSSLSSPVQYDTPFQFTMQYASSHEPTLQYVSPFEPTQQYISPSELTKPGHVSPFEPTPKSASPPKLTWKYVPPLDATQEPGPSLESAPETISPETHVSETFTPETFTPETSTPETITTETSTAEIFTPGFEDENRDQWEF